MSIATELQNYNTYLTNAYNKCSDKGATIPQNKNCQNLTSTINSIKDENYFFNHTTTKNQSYAIAGLIKKLPSPITIASGTTSMTYFFHGLRNITSVDLSTFDTTGVTNMDSFFSLCQSLPSITFPNTFVTSSLTSCNNMFSDCQMLTSLDLSNFNTKNVTSCSSMFSNCLRLASITFGSNFTCEKSQNFTSMFSANRQLTSLNLSTFNMRLATGCSNMFYDCRTLETLTLGNDYVLEKCNAMGNCFANCYALTNIVGSLQNIGQNYTSSTTNYSAYKIDFSASTTLTHDSMMNIINGVYDLLSANKKRQQLVFGTTNLARLSSSEIAVATNKGWNVS